MKLTYFKLEWTTHEFLLLRQQPVQLALPSQLPCPLPSGLFPTVTPSYTCPNAPSTQPQHRNLWKSGPNLLPCSKTRRKGSSIRPASCVAIWGEKGESRASSKKKRKEFREGNDQRQEKQLVKPYQSLFHLLHDKRLLRGSGGANCT